MIVIDIALIKELVNIHLINVPFFDTCSPALSMTVQEVCKICY